MRISIKGKETVFTSRYIFLEGMVFLFFLFGTGVYGADYQGQNVGGAFCQHRTVGQRFNQPNVLKIDRFFWRRDCAAVNPVPPAGPG